jgi:uncharacterized FAD-dependent dehydrogenase
MQQQITLRLTAAEAATNDVIKNYIAQATAKPVASITGFYINKHSIDARAKRVWINLTVTATIEEPFIARRVLQFQFKDVRQARYQIVIVGAGPAGLFAALTCIEQGIKPIIVERGKDVRARRRDIAILNREGEVNPESNYCFGEGGAGTYSDGKLYTRSNKRGNIDKVLQLLYHFGADERILFEAHPHIGTNKLPQIISSVRQFINECGGDVRFEQKVTGLKIDKDILKAVVTNSEHELKADAFILATGHSARDIYQLLFENNIFIEQKPFALGVRVEHAQDLIDGCQYRLDDAGRPEYLPPASYSLVNQVNGRGVFSFCMCPGGIIAPAATSPGELVVNGWSPSKRNNAFANSGIVVQVDQKDVLALLKNEHWELNVPLSKKQELAKHPLLLMYFQQMVEQKAFMAGGGKLVAPAQRMVDFTGNKLSATIPVNSYLPGLHSAQLNAVLPPFVFNTLVDGFKAFGNKMPGRYGRGGYFTNEAVIVATESRTSSPVRIPRNDVTCEHPQIKNLYPCGEGGGFAGGIVSAAMDGERVAISAIKKLIAL